MSNPYLTVAQFNLLYDVRTSTELSDDTGAGTGNDAATQLIVDLAASEVDTLLQGRYGLPLVPATIPAVLTKITAVKAIRSLFARRADLPKGLQGDLDWAAKWEEDFIAGKVNLPGISRDGAVPAMPISAAADGSSRFDNLPLQDNSGNTPTSAGHGNRGVLSGF